MKSITFSKSLAKLAATAVLIWAAVPACTANEPNDDLRPNILLTRFHTAPMCAPTRAMLLSGRPSAPSWVLCCRQTFELSG